MRIVIISLALVAILHGDANAQKPFNGECCEDYCYSSDTVKPQTKHFTSRSAYQIVKGTEYKDQAAIPNCTPVKIWIMSRHGTRLPEAETIEDLDKLETLRDKIVKNHKTDKKTKPATGLLCDGDLELIKNWVLDKNITVDFAEFLTVQGWNDLKMLAKDYQNVFPELLPAKYDETEFLFRHTDTQRTQASYRGFVEGLFGADAYQRVKVAEIPEEDTLLRPFDFCPLWNEQDEKKKEAGSEPYKFKYSLVMNQTIADISTRLGFDTPLKYKQVQLIWDICRFESAWFLDKPSPWCTALTLDQVKVLEYNDDITKQSKYGYASTLDNNLPCEIIQDMITRLSSDSGPRASAYFTHSAQIQLFAVGLGIMKDSSLLKSAEYDIMADRKWRISHLDPFAANVAAIKYDCSANVEDPSPKVKFFLNQKPMELDGCNNGVCKLSDLRTNYESYLNANCKNTYCMY